MALLNVNAFPPRRIAACCVWVLLSVLAGAAGKAQHMHRVQVRLLSGVSVPVSKEPAGSEAYSLASFGEVSPGRTWQGQVQVRVRERFRAGLSMGQSSYKSVGLAGRTTRQSISLSATSFGLDLVVLLLPGRTRVDPYLVISPSFRKMNYLQPAHKYTIRDSLLFLRDPTNPQLVAVYFEKPAMRESFVQAGIEAGAGADWFLGEKWGLTGQFSYYQPLGSASRLLAGSLSCFYARAGLFIRMGKKKRFYQ
jgi:hypothetical protein